MIRPVRSFRSAAIALTVTVLAGTAAAQPGALPPGAEEAPPPPPSGTVVTITPQTPPAAPAQPQVMAVVAPLNEDWSNVNHINGHPVPVGDRGKYLHAHKKTNIASNPLGWMFGFYGVSVSHALNKNIAIRGDVNFFNFEDESGYEFGASLPIYFRRVYSGPFLEPGIITRDFDTDDEYCDYDCGSSASTGPSMMFGWHWIFDSGANVAFAFGAMRRMNDQRDYGENVEPAGYFRIGYAY